MLSDREAQVLNYVALGLNNRQIAAELHISHETVKSHLRKVYLRFNALNRAHAIFIGVALGYIQITEEDRKQYEEREQEGVSDEAHEFFLNREFT